MGQFLQKDTTSQLSFHANFSHQKLYNRITCRHGGQARDNEIAGRAENDNNGGTVMDSCDDGT